MMLDCGLSMQSVLNFLPLTYVPSNKLMSLSNWMPTDISDADLEGVDISFIESLQKNNIYIYRS